MKLRLAWIVILLTLSSAHAADEWVDPFLVLGVGVAASWDDIRDAGEVRGMRIQHDLEQKWLTPAEARAALARIDYALWQLADPGRRRDATRRSNERVRQLVEARKIVPVPEGHVVNPIYDPETRQHGEHGRYNVSLSREEIIAGVRSDNPNQKYFAYRGLIALRTLDAGLFDALGKLLEYPDARSWPMVRQNPDVLTQFDPILAQVASDPRLIVTLLPQSLNRPRVLVDLLARIASGTGMTRDLRAHLKNEVADEIRTLLRVDLPQTEESMIRYRLATQAASELGLWDAETTGLVLRRMEVQHLVDGGNAKELSRLVTQAESELGGLGADTPGLIPRRMGAQRHVDGENAKEFLAAARDYLLRLHAVRPLTPSIVTRAARPIFGQRPVTFLAGLRTPEAQRELVKLLAEPVRAHNDQRSGMENFDYALKLYDRHLIGSLDSDHWRESNRQILIELSKMGLTDPVARTELRKLLSGEANHHRFVDALIAAPELVVALKPEIHISHRTTFFDQAVEERTRIRANETLRNTIDPSRHEADGADKLKIFDQLLEESIRTAPARQDAARPQVEAELRAIVRPLVERPLQEALARTEGRTQADVRGARQSYEVLGVRLGILPESRLPRRIAAQAKAPAPEKLPNPFYDADRGGRSGGEPDTREEMIEWLRSEDPGKIKFAAGDIARWSEIDPEIREALGKVLENAEGRNWLRADQNSKALATFDPEVAEIERNPERMGELLPENMNRPRLLLHMLATIAQGRFPISARRRLQSELGESLRVILRVQLPATLSSLNRYRYAIEAAAQLELWDVETMSLVLKRTTEVPVPDTRAEIEVVNAGLAYLGKLHTARPLPAGIIDRVMRVARSLKPIGFLTAVNTPQAQREMVTLLANRTEANRGGGNSRAPMTDFSNYVERVVNQGMLVAIEGARLTDPEARARMRTLLSGDLRNHHLIDALIAAPDLVRDLKPTIVIRGVARLRDVGAELSVFQHIAEERYEKVRYKENPSGQNDYKRWKEQLQRNTEASTRQILGELLRAPLTDALSRVSGTNRSEEFNSYADLWVELGLHEEGPQPTNICIWRGLNP